MTKVNEDGSFHVGGNTAVWPRRIEARSHEHVAVALMGRVIGFAYEYELDPSQYKEGEPSVAERTIWGRVIDGGYDCWGGEIVFAECLHDGEFWGLAPETIHTIMPERY
ncbi:hypothetical protein [Erythrobacter phage vB_EliS-L02]|nr:hypothetical protein [Erythrobacter phage vB_EliS-L02]